MSSYERRDSDKCISPTSPIVNLLVNSLNSNSDKTNLRTKFFANETSKNHNFNDLSKHTNNIHHLKKEDNREKLNGVISLDNNKKNVFYHSKKESDLNNHINNKSISKRIESNINESNYNVHAPNEKLNYSTDSFSKNSRNSDLTNNDTQIIENNSSIKGVPNVPNSKVNASYKSRSKPERNSNQCDKFDNTHRKVSSSVEPYELVSYIQYYYYTNCRRFQVAVQTI